MKKLLVIALSVFTFTGCSTENKRTGIGAGVGAAAGAGLGAIIGHQSGNAGTGAVVGGLIGAAVGGAIGATLDKQAKELAKVAETKRTEQGIVTKLKGDILFDSGKAELKPAAVNNLNQIGDILKKYPENRITVVGHTDNTGAATTNKVLSEQRAEAVKMTLVQRGVPDNAIKIVGMGPAQPLVDNSTPSGRSQNRRVELNITMEEQKKN